MKHAPDAVAPAGSVILVGDVAADLVATIPSERSEWQSDSPPLDATAGGTVGNTACALARLGVRAAVLSAVGADLFGTLVRQRLTSEGVDTCLLSTDHNRFTLVVVAVTGAAVDRFFWIHPATNAAPWSRTIWQDDRKAILSARWLHASGSGLGETVLAATTLEAMAIARAAGIPVSLDLNVRPHGEGLSRSYQQRLRDAIDLADVVLGSAEDEVTAAAGMRDPLAAARALAGGRRTVVVRMGRDGAYVIPGGRFVDGPREQSVPGYPVDVVSTLGAGDVFNAGLIASLIQETDVVQAAQMGNATAALSCTASGSYSAVDREAVRSLLLSQGHD